MAKQTTKMEDALRKAFIAKGVAVKSERGFILAINSLSETKED